MLNGRNGRYPITSIFFSSCWMGGLKSTALKPWKERDFPVGGSGVPVGVMDDGGHIKDTPSSLVLSPALVSSFCTHRPGQAGQKVCGWSLDAQLLVGPERGANKGISTLRLNRLVELEELLHSGLLKE
jgi:hypothetical protein